MTSTFTLRASLARWARGLALGCLLSSSMAVVLAQAVLKGGAATSPAALEDLLAIPDAKAPPGSAERGFRVAEPGAKPKPYGPGKANLLVTFVTGSAELAPDAKAVLDPLGRAMQGSVLAGVSFKVQGHADARGKASDNDALSLARAEAVVAYLKQSHGVLAERLLPEGRGSREPMNKSRVDAPENRRVTILSVRR
jgi:OmpA-OmpF porin, OOP family